MAVRQSLLHMKRTRGGAEQDVEVDGVAADAEELAVWTCVLHFVRETSVNENGHLFLSFPPLGAVDIGPEGPLGGRAVQRRPSQDEPKKMQRVLRKKQRPVGRRADREPQPTTVLCT